MQVEERFVGWADDWEQLRRSLLTYANAHPSETVREQAEETVKVMGTSLGATRYLFLMQNSPSGTDAMETFRTAEVRQKEAIESAERLLKTIRDY